MSAADVHNLSFYKKTRRGGIVKVVRELYLRDSIPCGSRACSLCPGDDSARTLDDLASNSSLSGYVVFDTNVILKVRG